MSFCTAYLLALLATVNFIAANDVITAFRENDIIPYVIDADDDLESLKRMMGSGQDYGRFKAKRHLARARLPIALIILQLVNYGNCEVNLGNKLTPTQVIDEPTVTWKCDPNEYSTLIMTDPDVPSRTNQSLAEFIHWLVGNIPGENICKGDTIVEYVGSAPPLGSDFHRYIFFLFKQPGKLEFDEPRLEVNGTGMERIGFSTRSFAEKYNLTLPEAGNFFLAQYDDSVNETLALLGF